MKTTLIAMASLVCLIAAPACSDGASEAMESAPTDPVQEENPAVDVGDQDLPVVDPGAIGSESSPEEAQMPPPDEAVAVVAPTASGGPTGAQINKALKWFADRNGKSTFEHQCEKAVELSFDRSGIFLNAKAAYECARKKGILHASSTAADAKSIPRGATLFYRTSADYHVALFEGYYTQNGKTGGRLRSTSVRGKIGQAMYPYFQNPLGWALVDWAHITRACK